MTLPAVRNALVPQSRIALSPGTQRVWQGAQQVFGIPTPNVLTVADVQQSNRQADAVEDQVAMLKVWARNARKTMQNIAGMEQEKASLLGEVKSQLTATDKALASSTIKTAEFGASQRLMHQQTGNALNVIREKSNGDVQHENMSFAARLRANLHSNQIRATNLGRTTSQAMSDLSANNQFAIAAGQQARVASNQRSQRKRSFMGLLSAR